MLIIVYILFYTQSYQNLGHNWLYTFLENCCEKILQMAKCSNVVTLVRVFSRLRIYTHEWLIFLRKLVWSML
jgi:hypothetical protein